MPTSSHEVPRRHRTWGFVAAGVLLAGLAAGCGGSSQGAHHASAPTTPTSSPGTGGAGATTTTSPAGATSSTTTPSTSPTTKPAPITYQGSKVSIDDHGSRRVVGQKSTEVDVKEYYFSPSVLIGSPGQVLKLTVVDRGQTSHTFTIASQHINKVLQPGHRVVVTVRFPHSGRTVWVCQYHVSSGMAGELVAT